MGKKERIVEEMMSVVPWDRLDRDSKSIFYQAYTIWEPEAKSKYTKVTNDIREAELLRDNSMNMVKQLQAEKEILQNANIDEEKKRERLVAENATIIEVNKKAQENINNIQEKLNYLQTKGITEAFILEMVSSDVDSPDELLARIKTREENESLIVENNNLRATNTRLIEDNERVTKGLEEKSQFLEFNAKLAEQVRKANKMGLDAPQLEAVVEAAHEVAARHGLSQREALAKLESDLKENWEPKVGFENEVTRLQIINERLSIDIKGEEGKLERVNAEIVSKQGSLDALDKIKKYGVSESELPEWNEALEASGCSIQTFGKELKRLGGIKPFVAAREAELTVNLRKLEVEERKLRATLIELAGLEESLRSQIATLISEPVNSTIAALTDLKKTADFVRDASSQLKSNFDDPDTGLKAKSKEIISEIGQEWRREAQTQVKVINQTGEAVKSKILSVAEKVDEAMEESFEAGKIVGHYGYSRDLLRIIKGEPVDKLTGLTTLVSALGASGEWLQLNGMGDLRPEFNSLARSLEGRMKA